MSKFTEAIDLYKAEMTTMGLEFDETLLAAVAKGLGPSIYNNDSSRVSGTDQSELDRLKANFLIKKLGLEDGTALDEAMAGVITQMGSANRNKYRAIFYYLLVKKFGKESVYAAS